jgi:rhodanese-related sulfurtransferase
MIRELLTKDIQQFIKQNPNSVLIDVRSKEEWENVGKPDGNKINLETYFLSIRNVQGEINQNFFEEFENLKIDKKKEILVMCKAGGRSLLVSNMLDKEEYNCINISDGFEGNDQNNGWKNSGLPTV